MSTELTTAEKSRLAELEKVIKRHVDGFMEVGKALCEIRESKLYRGKFDSFDAYCEEVWHFTRSYASRVMKAVEVTKMLPIGNKPTNEGQVRPLTKLPPADQPAAWKEAVETAPKGKGGKPKLTAAHVETVVAKRLEPEPAAGEPEHAGNGKAQKQALPVDELDQPIEQVKVQEAFAGRAKLVELMARVSQIKKDLRLAANGPGGEWIEAQESDQRCDDLRRYIVACAPYAVCRLCAGRGCRGCENHGYMGKFRYDQTTPESMKAKGAA